MSERVSPVDPIIDRKDVLLDCRVVFLCVLGVWLLVSNVLKKPSWPEASTSWVPTSISATTENVQPLTNEAIFADVQRKVALNKKYKPTRRERMAFAKLWYAFNDGEPIPYEWDGKEDNEEKK